MLFLFLELLTFFWGVEKALEEVREAASTAKKAYTAALSLRTASQREVNDLLQRKSTWSSADVMR